MIVIHCIMVWPYHSDLNEIFHFDDELSAIEIAATINDKEDKLNSSNFDVDVTSVKQQAIAVDAQNLVVICT